MTPHERYLTIREQTEVFKNKYPLKNQILKHIHEAIDEERQRCVKIVQLYCHCDQAQILIAIRGSGFAGKAQS